MELGGGALFKLVKEVVYAPFPEQRERPVVPELFQIDERFLLLAVVELAG